LPGGQTFPSETHLKEFANHIYLVKCYTCKLTDVFHKNLATVFKTEILILLK